MSADAYSEPFNVKDFLALFIYLQMQIRRLEISIYTIIYIKNDKLNN